MIKLRSEKLEGIVVVETGSRGGKTEKRGKYSSPGRAGLWRPGAKPDCRRLKDQSMEGDGSS